MVFEMVKPAPIPTLEETRAELQKLLSSLRVTEHWTSDSERSLEERLAAALVAVGEINIDLADVRTCASLALELHAYDRKDDHLSLPALLKTSLEQMKSCLRDSDLLVLLKGKDSQDLGLDELDDCIEATFEYVDEEATVIVGNFNPVSTPDRRVLILAFRKLPF